MPTRALVRKKNKPPPPTIAAMPGFKPNISDEQALHLVLNVATLTITQRLEFGLLYQKVKDGIIVQIGRGRRDQVLAILKVADMLPKSAAAKREPRTPSTNPGDSYSAKRTEGTLFAEGLLARPMPSRPPPPRRTA